MKEMPKQILRLIFNLKYFSRKSVVFGLFGFKHLEEFGWPQIVIDSLQN